MNVALYLADQNPHRDRTLGITTYTEGLIAELVRRDQMAISALGSYSSYLSEEAAVKTVKLPFRTDRAAGRLISDQLHPLFCRLPCDLWHYPKGFIPAFLRYRQPVIGTVCDTILQHYSDHYPQERPRLAYQYWLTVLQRSISRLDAVITISEFSAACIREFCERYTLRCPPIHVTYLAANWESEAGLKEKKTNTVLHLASPQPHKQTGRLLEFWRLLEQQKKSELTLELIGPLNAADTAALGRLKSANHHQRLPKDELQARIGAAQALIVPSEIEGFGLPAIEAYSLGTPVVYVQNTAIEEVLGQGSPGGFTLKSVDSFQAALEEVLAMDSEKVRAKGTELRAKFTWSRCAEKTIAAYKSLLP